MTDDPKPDGRHARRSRNRLKIVHAFKELVREGRSSPTASDVAGRAQVGVRTVYRCFDDMAALYQEVIQVLHDEFVPRARLDLDTPDRRLRLDRLLERREQMFSDLEPFLLASEMKRHVYQGLADDYAFLLTMERDRLAFVVNPDRTLTESVFEALNAVTSFSFWRRLRIEQKLDRDAAGQAMASAARALLGAQTALPPVPSEYQVNEL